MNKMSYLFDACVPHCSTQKRIQRGLDEFFAKQEEMYQGCYKRKHPNEIIKDSKNNYNHNYSYDDYDDDDYDYDDYDDNGYGYDYIDDDDNEDDYDYDWI